MGRSDISHDIPKTGPLRPKRRRAPLPQKRLSVTILPETSCIRPTPGGQDPRRRRDTHSHTLFHFSPTSPPTPAGLRSSFWTCWPATSTMVTALSAGRGKLRLFDLPRRRPSPRRQLPPGPVLGRRAKLPQARRLRPRQLPPRVRTAKVDNATILLATTNGTRAAIAARQAGAQLLLAGSLLNAAATARALMPDLDARDTLLLCAGTNGQTCCRRHPGAGAIIFALLQATYRTDLAFTDTAWMAYHAFAAVRTRLPAALRLGQGGINVINAGLEYDIDHFARLDALPVGGGLIRRRWWFEERM